MALRPLRPPPLTFSVSPSGFLPFLPLPRGGTTLHPARLGHRLPRRGPPTRLRVTQEPRRRRRPGGSVSAWSPHRLSGRSPGAGGKARLTPSTLCRQRRRQPEGERVWPPVGGTGGAGPGVAERSARSPPAIASWAATPLTAHALDAAACVCVHVWVCTCACMYMCVHARVCVYLSRLSLFLPGTNVTEQPTAEEETSGPRGAAPRRAHGLGRLGRRPRSRVRPLQTGPAAWPDLRGAHGGPDPEEDAPCRTCASSRTPP